MRFPAVALAAAISAGAVASAVVLMGGEAGQSLRPSTGTLVLTDERFKCQDYEQPLNFDRVKVNLTANFTENIKVPVWFGQGGAPCGGRIGDLSALTVWGDVMKVTKGAKDLVIEQGFLECLDRIGGNVHQDVIQAQGGSNVTFRYLNTRCPTSNHSAFFVNSGSANPADWPRGIVCEFCSLGPTGTTVHIGHSFDSGVRDSYIGTGNHFTFRIGDEAQGVINERNTIVPVGGEMPYLVPDYPETG